MMMLFGPNPGIDSGVNIETVKLSRKYGAWQKYKHVSPTFAPGQFVCALKSLGGEFSIVHDGTLVLLPLSISVSTTRYVCVEYNNDDVDDVFILGRWINA